MKTTNRSGLRVLTWAVCFAALGFASCTDDKENKPGPPPVELKNQIEYDGGKLIDIRSVIFDVEESDLYTFYLSPTAGIKDVKGMNAAKDFLRVVVRNPKGTVNPDGDEFEIVYRDISIRKQTLNDVEKVRLSADLLRETNQLNLYVEVTLKSGKTLLVRYNGTCTESVPQVLVNQFEYDKGEPAAIRSAIFDVEETDLYTFYLSPTGGIVDVQGMTDAADFLRITVRNPDGTVNTAEEEFEIAYKEFVLSNQHLADAETVELSAELSAETQRLVLLVEAALKSGKTLRARYDGACTEAVPPALTNQFELNRQIGQIASVVERCYPAEGATDYLFYTESGITAPAGGTAPAMRIRIADGTVSEGIDLATADPAKVKLTCGEFENGDGTTGTLDLKKNADGTELTLSLDAKRAGSRLRAAYAGAFASGVESSDRLKVTAGGATEEGDLKRVFRYKESSMMNRFAFGLTDADAPAGLMQGAYAVEIELSSIGISSTIDLAAEGSKYTFVLHDYTSYKSYDTSKKSGDGITGTLTTSGTGDRLYLRFTAAFPDGPAVEGEWYGEVTPSAEPFELTPVKPFVPHLTILDPKDEVVTDQVLGAMEMRMEKNFRLRGGDPKYGGATFDAYVFYFRPEEYPDESVESPEIIPYLMIPVSYLGSENLDLAAPQDDLHWSFKINNSGFQYTEYTEKYTMFGSTSGYCPDDVRMTAIQHADKTWKVSFRMKDYGSYSSWAPDRKEGFESTIIIEWEGRATKYTGSKKNDLTDADY